MPEKKDLLDEIFSLMHQQMQAKQTDAAAEQSVDYEKRAERIDQLINLLLGKKGEVLPYRPIQQAKPPERH
jgi:hypothetical protein